MRETTNNGLKVTRRFIYMVLLIAGLTILSGCGAKKTIHLKVTDEQKNTFMFVDTSGKEIQYDSLIVGGKEVIDHHCTTMMGQGCVVFSTEEGQIVREAGRITYGGTSYTEAAELLYELDNGVLTITGTK